MTPNRGRSALATPPIALDASRLSDWDLHLFNEGSHLRLYEKLGAHQASLGGVEGSHFAVWAPDAEAVSVIGDFNGWERTAHPLRPRASSGIWEGFVRGAGVGDHYKYWVVSRIGGEGHEKADPFALRAEKPPRTASTIWTLGYEWSDDAWMESRRAANTLGAPISIYELHLGSWRRSPDAPERWLGYRDLAPLLVEYLAAMGFTHAEFMPLAEHPFYGSWGYQAHGYFAPTSRYGTPQDLMFLIDTLHQHGFGVILDWVPSHFPTDAHGLGCFDGTHLYEHSDPREGFHPDWTSYIFNYGRHEVRSFLLSSAMYWLEHYHLDGLRVDAVASMIYRDYSRREGEWLPNRYGGRENLEALDFLRRLNTEIYAAHPDVQTVAEESTAWPMVSRPTYLGGLGFGLKWDMGWMHDSLEYMRRDPVHRKHHHGELSFRMLYAFTENYVLALSHDEMVHGKGSLLAKMPGDDWQKFANLRLLLGYMWTQPGKKLLFMGGEFGQWAEWNHEAGLDWHLLEHEPHGRLQRWVRDLNACYRVEPALHELDCDPSGFEWVDCSDEEQTTLCYLRRARSTSESLLVAANFTPVPRHGFRIGVPSPGTWREILNSDADLYGGSGQGNLGQVVAEPIPWHGRESSVSVTLPPLAVVVFKA
jgi:1,4-alpha-glucan branching enzyme